MKTVSRMTYGIRFLLLAAGLSAAASLLLTYCGNGGGGYSSSGGTVYTYSISGSVSSGGSVLAGATMTLSGAGSASTTTDASGNYVFSGLANGSYTVTPAKTGYTFAPASSAQTISGANIGSVNFTATQNTAPTFGISGSVSSGGSALAGATMTLSGAGAASTTTDTSGNYAFSGLANGSYTVTPAKTGYTFAPVSSAQTVSGANVTGVNFIATSVQTVQAVTCPASGTTDVSIMNFAFNPATVTAPVNTIVKWTNNDSTTHTVTSTTVPANGAFDSSFLAPGSTVCFKFTTAGSYHYQCTIHTSMTGLVTVQ